MTVVQAGRQSDGFNFSGSSSGMLSSERKLYSALRNEVPIIDAAILKIIRLIGGLSFSCENKDASLALDNFMQSVKVGNSSAGLESFICRYLDSLLTYGCAVGEIVMDKDQTAFLGLYNADLDDITFKEGNNPMDIIICTNNGNDAVPIKHSELAFFTSLNPTSDNVYGSSLLKGLPFVSNILMQIFQSIKTNFERLGNIRYAVTYKPSSDGVDKAYAKERAMQIATEWSSGMTAARNGQITDFISVGDVSIKVIGADNQMIDTNIPVRQMMEQIVAKLGIPPFLLGLSWTTTERMSKQQADILTSELEYYRRLLTPVILKIATTYLRICGFPDEPLIEWDIINLQDEIEHSRAMLYKAQAEKLSFDANESAL